MPRIRYAVAVSLDGYIAGPKGDADWIIMDPDIDFGAIFAQFDTFLMGRRTFEGMERAGAPGLTGGKTFIFSRTLRPGDDPSVTIVPDVSPASVAPIRAQATKDIWLADRSPGLQDWHRIFGVRGHHAGHMTRAWSGDQRNSL